jgi:hypothetical protein
MFLDLHYYLLFIQCLLPRVHLRGMAASGILLALPIISVKPQIGKRHALIFYLMVTKRVAWCETLSYLVLCCKKPAGFKEPFVTEAAWLPVRS